MIIYSNNGDACLLQRIRNAVAASANAIDCSLEKRLGEALPISGKMLRSRVGVKLYQAGISDLAEDDLIAACSAVELVHTASLCHDDVIDNAVIRRHYPALWRHTTTSAAVLVGDLLLCEALDKAADAGQGSFVKLLLAKVAEVCRAEAEQELLLRQKKLTPAECVRIARQKTGPLFAFVCRVGGGSNEPLQAALEESGYLIGTGYQLMDDLVDAIGREDDSGKSLRNDASRRKYTLAHEWSSSPERLIAEIENVSKAAVQAVSAWPSASKAVEEFLNLDLQAVYNRLTQHAGIQWRLTA